MEEDAKIIAFVTGYCVESSQKHNTFSRKGVDAASLAFHMNWLTGKVAKSGRVQPDSWKAKSALERLVKEGKLKHYGMERTLSCGSTPKMTYSPL